VQTDAVIDGEIVALDKKGRPNFGLLQSRMKLTKKADVEKAMRSAPVHFMAFDLLESDGELPAWRAATTTDAYRAGRGSRPKRIASACHRPSTAT
jgi:ATP-dependent DNA ligase